MPLANSSLGGQSLKDSAFFRGQMQIRKTNSVKIKFQVKK